MTSKLVGRLIPGSNHTPRSTYRGKKDDGLKGIREERKLIKVWDVHELRLLETNDGRFVKKESAFNFRTFIRVVEAADIPEENGKRAINHRN